MDISVTECSLEEAKKAVVDIAGTISSIESGPGEEDVALLSNKDAIQTYQNMKRTLEHAKERIEEFNKRIEEDPETLAEEEKQKQEASKQLTAKWKLFLQEQKVDAALIEEIMSSIEEWPYVENDSGKDSCEIHSWGASSCNMVYFTMKGHHYEVEYNWVNNSNLNYKYCVDYKRVDKFPELAEKFFGIIDEEVEKGFNGKSELITA